MCGRYVLFTGDEYQEIMEIIREVERRNPDTQVQAGEVYPGSQAPVLTACRDAVSPELIRWGFPPLSGSRAIINARSETAEEKPMFRKSLYSTRCVVPTAGFYEWDRSKRKYLYRLPQANTLYLAGMYHEYTDGKRFTILTREAVGSAAQIHNRVPVLIHREYIEDWLFKLDVALSMMQWQPPAYEINRV
jgi:putative SOS response-associated peptidase YedK